MDARQAGLGSLLVSASGGLLTGTGAAGGQLLIAAGGIAMVATLLRSARERRGERRTT